jgi:hypothetical protein
MKQRTSVIYLFIGVIFASCASCARTGSELFDKYFNISEMEKELSVDNPVIMSNYIIIEWQITEIIYDRPLYICGVLGKAKCGNKQCLFIAYKHPKEPRPNNSWGKAIHNAIPTLSIKLYDNEITDKDINEFKRGWWWSSDVSVFRLIDSGHIK